MILTRAPLRLSYLGGGTDYPSFFSSSGGRVIGCTFDKYVYVFVNELAPISKEKIRFTYRNVESVNNFDELKHPTTREALRYFGIKEGLSIGTFSDLPAGAGLGGSSSFLVALIKALAIFNKVNMEPIECAELAARIEREILGEPGGLQDQFHASIGGFRSYKFSSESVTYSDQLLSSKELEYLSERHLLVWLGESRSSHQYSQVTKEYADKLDDGLKVTQRLAETLYDLLTNERDIKMKFRYLHDFLIDGWSLKQGFAKINSANIDLVINKCVKFDIKSWKLCGAGGHGFLLILAEPSQLAQLTNQLTDFYCFQPNLTALGSELISQI